MKKGFTLVELLAVIVIIGIIALIVVPIVTDVINDSKKEALESSAYGLIESGKIYYSNSLLKPNNYILPKTFDGPSYESLDFDGKKYPGKLIVKNDKNIAVAIYDEGICAYKKMSENKVNLVSATSLEECQKKIYVCFSENATISYDLGTKYICDPGDGKDRTFYVLDSSKDTVSLIMDRNIGGVVLYTSLEDYIQSGGSEAEFTPNGNNSLGPITAKKYLNKVTSNWKDVSVSLPTYKQLFNADSKNIWVYGNLWCSVGLCTEKVENDTAEKGYVYGYWLSDSCSETYHDRAYAMVEAGAGYGVFICTTVGTNSGDYLSLTGVRPVITILKVDIS